MRARVCVYGRGGGGIWDGGGIEFPCEWRAIYLTDAIIGIIGHTYYVCNKTIETLEISRVE